MALFIMYSVVDWNRSYVFFWLVHVIYKINVENMSHISHANANIRVRCNISPSHYFKNPEVNEILQVYMLDIILPINS